MYALIMLLIQSLYTTCYYSVLVTSSEDYGKCLKQLLKWIVQRLSLLSVRVRIYIDTY